MEKDIGKLNKGEYQGTTTDIVIGIREYNGSVGIDIREFVSSERYTGPTKKGLRIHAENFSDFKKMINSISEDDLKQAVIEAFLSIDTNDLETQEMLKSWDEELSYGFAEASLEDYKVVISLLPKLENQK